MDWLLGLSLVGTKTVIKQKWSGFAPCKHCQQHRPQVLMERTEWSTAFWIKIMPAKRERTLTCNYCKLATSLKKEEALQIMGATTPAIPR
jgi:hypothetical protein